MRRVVTVLPWKKGKTMRRVVTVLPWEEREVYAQRSPLFS